MKDYAQKTHLLASKWGIGNVKQELWRSHSNFLQRIIDNVAFNSHGWAVRKLEAYFGGEEGLSKSENKAAKRIIREASKPHHSMQAQGGAWPPLPSSCLPHDGNGDGTSIPSSSSANAYAADATHS